MSRVVRALVATLCSAALVSGCGNRNSYELLEAAATGGEPASAPNAAVPGGDGPGQGRAPGSVLGPGAVAGGAASGATPVAGNPGASANRDPGTGAERTQAVQPDNMKAAAEVAARNAPAACTSPLARIRIASVGHYSGVAGQFLVPGLKSLQVFIQAQNAQGGIACHPIELLVGDDQADPATSQALVRSFVEEKHVIAFVHMCDIFTGGATVAYLKQRGIPVIGSAGGQEWFNRNPNYFPQVASGSQYFNSIFQMLGATLVPQGKVKTALVSCVEAPLCSDIHGYAPAITKRYGIDLVYNGQVSITEPNYTSTCLAAKNSGAEVFILGVDGATDQRIARSCQTVGFKPIYATAAVVISPSQAAVEALSGVHISMVVEPWTQTTNPAMARYLAALARYAPGEEPTAAGIGGWISGLVFAAAASGVGVEPTSEQILQGAYKIKGDNFGGITQKLTYRAGAENQRQRQTCWWALVFQGAKVTTLNAGKETCETTE
jgi:ABC-type branched-subunit amino acid transport system substrate-binding protein